MSWKTDIRATKAAREAFPRHAPRVLCDGRQYLLNPTPFGRIELVGLSGGFLVAAENPPRPSMDLANLSPKLLRHLAGHGLRPWKIVQGDDHAEVIRSLSGPPLPEDEGLPEPPEPWSPYVCPLETSAELLGESRFRCCEQLAGLMETQRFPGPVAQLVGIDGIGKRTMAATMARWMGWSICGELPLARLLIERMLQTSSELLLDTLLAAGEVLGPADMLVVSDAELLTTLKRDRLPVLRELARLPHVVLLSRPSAMGMDNVIPLVCPGLESVEDARAMVADQHPELEFIGAGFDLLVQAASVHESGIVPGRLLYLVRLAKAFLSDRQKDISAEEGPCPVGVGENKSKIVLAPDEVSSAIILTRPAREDRIRADDSVEDP